MTKPDAPAFYGLISAGLTKREYFAGLAMQGLLASDNAGDFALPEKGVAFLSVCQADALIAELSKE